MEKSHILIGVAVLLVLLYPLVPRMIRLRIWVLRKLHLTWFADLHERHLELFTWVIRAIFLVLAILLLWQAYTM